jgi:glycosyltransferase involved in cell wall biosynthesis
VAQWLRAADLFVLPSHYEGGPAMALMEAMSSGCAAIATRVNGTEELIDSAQVGCLVPPRRPDALAAAIGDLLNDGARRLQLGEGARRRVVAAFDIRESHRRTLQLYRGLSGGA